MCANKNNFLRFTGSTTNRGFTITPFDTTFALFANVESVVIQPLVGCAASNGIDYTSFQITSIEDGFSHPITLSQECAYDGAGNLTVYRPTDITVTQIFIGCLFSDMLGNVSPAMFAIVNVSSIITAWQPYSPSAICTLDPFGNNTGFLSWGQLQLYNTGSGFPISPLTLKANVISDADYIAPVLNLTTCPLVYGTGQYAPLFISNFSQNNADSSPNNNITITNITLACTACGTGATPVLLNIPCNIAPGQTQRFNVPALAWDTGLTLTYTIHAGGNMSTATPQRFWQSNVAGLVAAYPLPGPNPVDNTGTFGNNAITIPYPGGLTIFCQ